MRWDSLFGGSRQVRRNTLRTSRTKQRTGNTTTEQAASTIPESKTSHAASAELGEGREKTPILDPTTGQINQKLLCGNCFKDYLRILRFSGPRFGRVKARAPPNGVWFSYGENAGSILFTQISGMWPCPACDEFYENLYDVVTHFAAKHTEIANKPNERVTVDIDGKTGRDVEDRGRIPDMYMRICRRER
jgi:hypothetical protein